MCAGSPQFDLRTIQEIFWARKKNRMELYSDSENREWRDAVNKKYFIELPAPNELQMRSAVKPFESHLRAPLKSLKWSLIAFSAGIGIALVWWFAG